MITETKSCFRGQLIFCGHENLIEIDVGQTLQRLK